jgi:hypothetical protein
MPPMYIPLLEKLLGLYQIPIGPQRFEAYIQLTIGEATTSQDVLLPPLVVVNPMAKAHALEHVQTLLELGAEKVAARTLEEVQSQLDIQNHFKVSLTLLDDLKGGWTNRYLNEAADYFHPAEKLKKSNWLGIPCWTGDTPSLKTIVQSVKSYVFRAVYALEHGDPKTLQEVLKQEGLAMQFAETEQWLEPDDLAYSLEVITPHLTSQHYPTQFACLFGDEAAKAVGYPAMGLSSRAGFALALAKERNSYVT